MTYVLIALAGLSVGGVIAMLQQKRPLWVVLVFGVVAAVFLALGLVSMQQQS